MRTITCSFFVWCFASFVFADSPSDFVVLHFTAKWCQPCKAIAPAIEQLADKGWLIRQVDVDREKDIVQRWKVTQLPTLIVLRGGKEVDRILGRRVCRISRPSWLVFRRFNLRRRIRQGSMRYRVIRCSVIRH